MGGEGNGRKGGKGGGEEVRREGGGRKEKGIFHRRS